MNEQLDPYTELIQNYAYVALRKIKKPSGMTFEDLFQEGAQVFLVAKILFNKDKKSSFKTWLIRLLRNHFNDIVVRSYHHKKESFHSISDQEKAHVMKYKLQMDPVEIVHISFLLNNFTVDELEYIKAMLQSIGEKHWSARRGLVRKTMGISYSREMKLRNSIADKVRK